MVVSHDAEDSLLMKVEEDRHERLEKEKVMRRLAFYEEYADNQLSRILISLLKEQKTFTEGNDNNDTKIEVIPCSHSGEKSNVV